MFLKLTRLKKDIKEKLYRFWYRLAYKIETVDIAEFFSEEELSIYHHISITLRLLYINSYFKGENEGIRDYLIAQRNFTNYIKRKYDEERDVNNFNNLIKSFLLNGYKSDYPIYVDLNGQIINGAHRVALCIYFGINKINIIRISKRVELPSVDECFFIFSCDGLEGKLRKIYKDIIHGEYAKFNHANSN